MKRKKMASWIAGISATTFQFAVPIPGCESTVLDPQAFFRDNTCNIFNCDTLFFLQGDHADDGHDEIADEHDEMETEELEDHTHG